jgi:membrane protease YdiL (CAAX protease family)
MNKLNVTAASLLLAAILWTLIFLDRPLNFWLMMSFSTLLLMMLTILINREKIEIRPSSRMLLLGIISSILLYSFFYVGFQLTRSNPIFNEGIAHVYDLRSATPNIIIAMLLVFPIASGEEVYWRGLIQRRFMGKIGGNAGFLFTASAYALVHLPTMNLPLILTAFIGGLVWGYLYKATNQLQPVIVSHVIFDLLIFVIAPFS